MKKIIVWVLALLLATMLIVFTAPSSASASEPCVPTNDQTVTEWFESNPGAPWSATGDQRVKTAGTNSSYTEWANTGDVVRTEEKVAPGVDTDTSRYQFVGETETEVTTPAVEEVWANFKPDNQQATFVGPAVYPDDERGSWNVHDKVPGGHEKHPNGVYSVGDADKGGNWFYKQAGSPAVTDVDYLWQQQTRTFVPGTDTVYEYEYTKVIEGKDCPDEPVKQAITPDAPTFVDKCGTLNDDWFAPESDQTEILYTLGFSNGELGVIATLNPDATDEFVLADGAQVFWPVTWTDEKCPGVITGTETTVEKDRDYECGDDFVVITTTTTVTPWSITPGKPKEYGEPVRKSVIMTIKPAEVVACDKPDEPNKPTVPNEPKAVAVPTVVDAGLGGPVKSGSFEPTLPLALFLMGLVTMGMALARRHA